MTDKIDKSEVTDAEIAGVLAPEVAALSKELDAMKHTVELQAATIENMQAALSFANKEIFKVTNNLNYAFNIMRAKQLVINKMDAELINANRTIHVTAFKLRIAKDELETIREYLFDSVYGSQRGQDDLASDFKSALEMLHTLMTSLEIKEARNAKYDPQLEVNNCRALADAEREARMAAQSGSVQRVSDDGVVVQLMAGEHDNEPKSPK